jgi:hypothetical protein
LPADNKKSGSVDSYPAGKRSRLHFSHQTRMQKTQLQCDSPEKKYNPVKYGLPLGSLRKQQGKSTAPE